ncbi:MAG: ComEC/Rec2 family competence protein [Dehalococcoidia bacterium]
MWLLYVSCAWIAGIFLGSKTSLPFLALSVGLIPFLLIPFLPGSRKTLVIAGLCLLAILGGSLRLPSTSPPVGQHSLAFYNDKGVVQMQGTVADEADVRDGYCLLTFSTTEVVVDGEMEEVQGNALIQTTQYPSYRYGDVLLVTGQLETPNQFGDFDYETYLARQGIHSVIYYPRIGLVDRGQGVRPLQWIYYLRERLSASLARVLPEPQGSLAQAILLGHRGDIPDPLYKAFSRTGTAHLLAISGLHMSIVLAIFLSFGIMVFGRRRGIYVWIALAAIWSYALLAGMGPPVIRAAIMGSLFLIAEYLGRQRSAIIALAFAAAVMVGIQPYLLWSLSFQLSFLAMAGLVLLFPHFQTWGRKMVLAGANDREMLANTGAMITDIFAASLAAVLAVWPLIAYNFGIVSLATLPATFLSLPALPFIIVTAALVASAGLVSLFVAQVLGWLAWLFLSYLIFVVRAFDSLPYSSVEVTNISTWHILGYYAILATVIAFLSYRNRLVDFPSRFTSRMKKLAEDIPKPRSGFSSKWLILPLLVVAILVWSVALTTPDGKLHVSFLDVGQGDAMLIQTPGGRNILIDGGPDSEKINLALGQRLPFWDRTIDLVVCTQPQADHVTGLIEVLQRYRVDQVLGPRLSSNSATYREWLRLVEDNGIKHEIARAGQEIALGSEIKIEVFNPPEHPLEGTSHDVDNNGVVLRLSWNQFSFLFPADIRKEAEYELIMQRTNLESTVLKVPHHGSTTSTTPHFLAAVNPEVAVISAGSDNPFGHPHPDVLQRLIDTIGEDNVYRTDQDGTIEFITDGQRLWVVADD